MAAVRRRAAPSRSDYADCCKNAQPVSSSEGQRERPLRKQEERGQAEGRSLPATEGAAPFSRGLLCEQEPGLEALSRLGSTGRQGKGSDRHTQNPKIPKRDRNWL